VSRLVILGLDGGTFDLMRPWAESGRLPAFAELLERGACGELRSVPNMNTAPAWTTFMTGKNPGKHGVFWFAEQGVDAGTVRFVSAADRHGVSLWRLLSDAGRRVGAVNVPMTYPAEPVNGVLVAGFDAPSTRNPAFTYPDGLIAEIERECGTYVLHASVSHDAATGNHSRVVDEALSAEESRVRAALHLMETRDWDVFMYMIKSTDQVAHHAWQYGAPTQEHLLPVYMHADRTLARFLELAGDDRNVIVMSDHGMGWRQPAAEYLNDILGQLGYLRRGTSSGAAARWRALRLAKRMGPAARGFLKRRLPNVYRRFGYQIRFGGLDWEHTRAFSDNTRSCVWINLEGRNPNGIVPPDERETLAKEIREVLLALVDPATGAPAVEAVWTPEEIYAGPFTDRAPDLQIDWRYERPVSGLAYDGPYGRAVSRGSGKGFMHGLSGAHRQMGVLMMDGPAFAGSRRIEGASLQDVTPTILHLSGLPVPDDMDGNVLRSALAEPHASRPVSHVEGAGDAQGPAATYTDQEAEEIEERLSALGYL
jgi:predicted AlkP superfamily phosphohydrolase/phosphomutase